MRSIRQIVIETKWATHLRVAHFVSGTGVEQDLSNYHHTYSTATLACEDESGRICDWQTSGCGETEFASQKVGLTQCFISEDSGGEIIKVHFVAKPVKSKTLKGKVVVVGEVIKLPIEALFKLNCKEAYAIKGNYTFDENNSLM